MRAYMQYSIFACLFARALFCLLSFQAGTRMQRSFRGLLLFFAVCLWKLTIEELAEVTYPFVHFLMFNAFARFLKSSDLSAFEFL